MPDFSEKSDPTSNRNFRLAGWPRPGDRFFDSRRDLALPPLPTRPAAIRATAKVVFRAFSGRPVEAAQ
jgi:hypothetical protein